MNTDAKFGTLEALRAPFEEYLKEIQSVEVVTQEQYEAAAEGLKALKGWQKDITDYFEPERQRTYDAYNAVTTEKGSYIKKAEAVEKVIKKKMGEYQLAEQQRIRQAQIEADQKEAEARRQLAAMNPSPEAPVVVSDVIIPAVPEATKVSGISVTKTWRFEITDMSAIKDQFWTLNEALILRVVKDFGPEAEKSVGGIRVIEDVQIGSRRG